MAACGCFVLDMVSDDRVCKTCGKSKAAHHNDEHRGAELVNTTSLQAKLAQANARAEGPAGGTPSCHETLGKPPALKAPQPTGLNGRPKLARKLTGKPLADRLAVWEHRDQIDRSTASGHLAWKKAQAARREQERLEEEKQQEHARAEEIRAAQQCELEAIAALDAALPENQFMIVVPVNDAHLATKGYFFDDKSVPGLDTWPVVHRTSDRKHALLERVRPGCELISIDGRLARNYCTTESRKVFKRLLDGDGDRSFILVVFQDPQVGGGSKSHGSKLTAASQTTTASQTAGCLPTSDTARCDYQKGVAGRCKRCGLPEEHTDHSIGVKLIRTLTGMDQRGSEPEPETETRPEPAEPPPPQPIPFEERISDAGASYAMELLAQAAESADISIALDRLDELATATTYRQAKSIASMAECGGMKVISDVMQKHTHDAGVQRRACLLIYNLCRTARFSASIYATDLKPVVRALLSACRYHPDDEAVQWSGLAALTALGSSETGTSQQVGEKHELSTTSVQKKQEAAAVISGGGAKVAVQALKMHEANKHVCQQALYHIIMRCIDDARDDNIEVLLRENAMEAICSALTSHSTDRDIQTYGVFSISSMMASSAAAVAAACKSSVKT
eukprot:COSAG02_NODE_9405_length_2226_cov_1.526538_1_plen_621_part_01